MSNLTIDPAIEQKLIDLAIDHIKKVEANPDVKTEGDNFDYWNSYELSDGNFIDYNIHEHDGGASNNPSKWEWGLEAYQVDEPCEDNDFHYMMNTDVSRYLMHYKNNKPHTK